MCCYNPFEDLAEVIRKSYDPTKGKSYYPACDSGNIIKSQSSIIEHWQKSSDDVVRLNLSPSPFLGNVGNTEIVILSLNPGFGDLNIGGWKNLDAQQRQHYRDIEADEMTLQSNGFGTTITDPVFQALNGTYWLEKLEPLMVAKGYAKGSQQELDALNKFSLIDWFPYHSEKSPMSLGGILPSQQWVFKCVMLDVLLNAKMIIITRAAANWYKSVPALRTVQSKVFELNSNQFVKFTQGNMPEECWNNLLSII